MAKEVAGADAAERAERSGEAVELASKTERNFRQRCSATATRLAMNSGLPLKMESGVCGIAQ